jgi:type I restriction enzyme S subunit
MESNLVQNLVNLKSLPEKWAVKDFKEVVSDNSGGNKKLAKSNFLKEGVIAVIDQGKKLIAGFYNDTSLAVKTQPPYVVFGDHTRAFKYVDFPFIMGADGTKVLQPKKENCETKYLYYFFLSINVPNTGYNRHFKYLKELKIPLPPLEQQKKIAAILDAADTYRQKTKALITKYDALTQSLFLDMFGDLVNNPKGWDYIPFGNVFKSLRYGTSSPPIYSDIGIPFIRATNVKNGGVAIKGLVFISQEEADKIKKCKLQESDLIIVRSGSNTGDCSRIPKEYEGAYGGFDIIVKIDEPYSSFYNFLLNTPASKAMLEPLTRRAGQPHLNSKQITELRVFDIPIDLQNQFADSVKVIEAQKTQAQASLVQAEDLFNSLLQRAFKGELV